MQLEDHTFTDAGEHAALLAGWDQQYFQLDCGSFRSTLQQLNADGVHLFYESVNRRVAQRGSAPDGMVAFGIVLDAMAPLTYSGRSITPESMIFARANREFFMHCPGGTELLGIALSQAQLDRHALLSTRVRGLIAANTVAVPVAPAAREQIVARWRRFVDDARAWLAFADRALAERCITLQLIELLDLMLDDDHDARETDITWMSHSDVVARVHQMIVARPQEPVTVQQISEALRVSRRTVQNSFRLVTGKSPVEYMRAVRLNFVRQLLRTTPAADLTVRDAAQRWGFFHSGHFTQDYRKLFDAMPSDHRPH